MINNFWNLEAQAHCLLCGKELKTDCLNYFLDMLGHYNERHLNMGMGIIYKPIYLYNTTKMSNENNNQNQETEVTKEKTVEKETETVEKESE